MSRVWAWLLARPKPAEQPPRILPLTMGAVGITLAIVLPLLDHDELEAVRHGLGILIICLVTVAAILFGARCLRRWRRRHGR